MSNEHALGDGPIDAEHRAQMNAVAEALDDIFNGTPESRGTKLREIGFVLLVFPFGSHDGRCNFISNGADRKDIVSMFREMVARFEGMPGREGRA